MTPIVLWMGAALTVKRLHDLGLSGKHALWIMALNLFGSFAPVTTAYPAANAVGWTAGLLSFGAALALIFTPGNDGENRFGPAPVSLKANADGKVA